MQLCCRIRNVCVCVWVSYVDNISPSSFNLFRIFFIYFYCQPMDLLRSHYPHIPKSNCFHSKLLFICIRFSFSLFNLFHFVYGKDIYFDSYSFLCAFKNSHNFWTKTVIKNSGKNICRCPIETLDDKNCTITIFFLW